MQFYLGDCLVEMSNIPNHSVDLILCDLPYGTTVCKWDVVIPFEPLWEHYWRVLKPNGAIVLFGSEPFSSHLRMSQIKHFKYDWVWDKKIPSGMSYARFQPMRQHEVVSVFSRERMSYHPQCTVRPKPITSGGVKPSESAPIKYKDANFKKTYSTKNPTSLIAFDKIRRGSVHPTQKPVPLLEYLIKTYTNEGETVLDNCMGSGSTGVACVNTNRNFIGIEKDDKYFEIAKNRINTQTRASRTGVSHSRRRGLLNRRWT